MNTLQETLRKSNPRKRENRAARQGVLRAVQVAYGVIILGLLISMCGG